MGGKGPTHFLFASDAMVIINNHLLAFRIGEFKERFKSQLHHSPFQHGCPEFLYIEFSAQLCSQFSSSLSTQHRVPAQCRRRRPHSRIRVQHCLSSTVYTHQYKFYLLKANTTVNAQTMVLVCCLVHTSLKKIPVKVSVFLKPIEQGFFHFFETSYLRNPTQ